MYTDTRVEELYGACGIHQNKCLIERWNQAAYSYFHIIAQFRRQEFNFINSSHKRESIYWNQKSHRPIAWQKFYSSHNPSSRLDVSIKGVKCATFCQWSSLTPLFCPTSKAPSTIHCWISKPTRPKLVVVIKSSSELGSKEKSPSQKLGAPVTCERRGIEWKVRYWSTKRQHTKWQHEKSPNRASSAKHKEPQSRIYDNTTINVEKYRPFSSLGIHSCNVET